MKKLNKIKPIVFCFLLAFVFTNKTKAQDDERKRDTNYIYSNYSTCPAAVGTSGIGVGPTDAQGIYPTDLDDIQMFPSSDPQSEVHISIDKNNPWYLVASSNVVHPIPPYGLLVDDQAYYYSIDGGVTWHGSETYPSLTSYNSTAPTTPFPWSPDDGDPATTFDGRGYGFVSTMENTYNTVHADPQNGFYMVNSQDNGTTPWASSSLPTWSSPATATSGVTTVGSTTESFDRPTIAADNEPYSPYYNYVYCVGTE